ncbi:BgTH12-01709 [Blumeria graminis f. sp. triticale]|uniref:BgTH12-01709 n=1 Tax=Blumeria graminis f. sp. triticale TaxID=1689686 RepID=A0A9W4GDE3_BLUGR|nr:BgTH12-01709 [Blumeria graminis f. sp. triticale]
MLTGKTKNRSNFQIILWKRIYGSGSKQSRQNLSSHIGHTNPRRERFFLCADKSSGQPMDPKSRAALISDKSTFSSRVAAFAAVLLTAGGIYKFWEISPSFSLVCGWISFFNLPCTCGRCLRRSHCISLCMDSFCLTPNCNCGYLIGLAHTPRASLISMKTPRCSYTS